MPDFVLRFTSPDGPQPVVINLPSRGQHKIPVYAFIPPSLLKAQPKREKVPVLIDFHGGGFIFGSCQEQAPFCAKFARELGCLVLSVDYRLGPYAKFPAAIEDGEDIVNAILDPSKPGYSELRDAIAKEFSAVSLVDGKKWKPPIIALDTTRIALSGFSSGSNLALNLALSIEHSAEMPSAWPSVFPPSLPRSIPLLLFFPSLDCRQLPSERPRPGDLNKKPGFLASLRLEDELMPKYLPRDQAGQPRASPGLAKVADGGLHSQARMMLVLPELDSLAQQSEIWVKKVQAEGRGDDLQVERYKGMVHGWTQFPDSFIDDDAKRLKIEIFDKSVDFVSKAWELSSPSASS